MDETAETLALYELMLLIRRAEEVIANYYLDNKIFSFVHFSIGQELSAASFGIATETGDLFLGNHRSHHHYLAKGGSLFEMFSEMLGKATGCAKGKGGSMHMFQPSVGFMGTSPILSSSIPIALGLAKSLQEEGLGRVSVAFTGDGATEEGNFYESLNLAKLWNLPILIVVEDNKYAVNSPASKRRPEGFSFRSLAEAFSIPYFEISSDNPKTSLRTTKEAVEHARLRGPVLVMCHAYRFLAHSSPLSDEHANYRLEDLGQVRKERDPIAILKGDLIKAGVTTSKLQDLEETLDKFVMGELARAVKAPAPDARDLNRGLYGD